MQLPLLPLRTTDGRPDLQGTQPLKELTPEENAARVAKRMRDIRLVKESELYQYYREHRGEFRIERPSVKASTVGCRAWHCAMREWKAKLHRFREEHSAEST